MSLAAGAFLYLFSQTGRMPSSGHIRYHLSRPDETCELLAACAGVASFMIYAWGGPTMGYFVAWSSVALCAMLWCRSRLRALLYLAAGAAFCDLVSSATASAAQ